MIGMGDASYGHGYLMARHHVSLIMGIVLMSMALIFTLTGKCLTKYKGIVSRADAPKTYWQNIATYCVLGLLCLGLYVYTFN
jgi:hypothetical protein